MALRRALGFLPVVLGACVAATSSQERQSPSLQSLLEQLNRTETEVGNLEAVVSRLRRRIAAAEKVAASSYADLFTMQIGVVQLQRLAGSLNATAAKVRRTLAQSRAAVEIEEVQFGQSQEQADRVYNMSAKLAAAVEQLVDTGTVKLRDGLCLDAPEPSKRGSGVRLWTCLKGTESQEWDYAPATGQLKSRVGLCLDAPPAQQPPAAPTSAVLMWACDAALATQRWAFDASSGQLRASSGRCLAASARQVRGADLQLRACDVASPEQQWHLVVGGLGASRELETLNKQIWDVMDLKSPNSVDETERRARKVEQELKDVKGRVSETVQAVVAKRLRHRVDGMRAAWRNLGALSTGSELRIGLDATSSPAPLGADLGLNG